MGGGSEEGKITQKRKNTSQVVGQSLEGGGSEEGKNNPEKKRHIPCGRPESRGQGERGEYYPRKKRDVPVVVVDEFIYSWNACVSSCDRRRRRRWDDLIYFLEAL